MTERREIAGPRQVLEEWYGNTMCRNPHQAFPPRLCLNSLQVTFVMKWMSLNAFCSVPNHTRESMKKTEC